MRNFIITSDDAKVAEGVVFTDGAAVVRWSDIGHIMVVSTVKQLVDVVLNSPEIKIVWSSTLL